MRIEVDGLLDLQAALRELGEPKAIKTALRGALRKAGKPMLEKIRDGVSLDKGDYKRAVKMAAAKGERADSPEFGIVIGVDSNEQPAKIVTRKTRSNRGRGGTYRDPGVAGVSVMDEFGTPTQPANPAFRRGFDTEGEATIRRFGEAAMPEIEKVAARLARRRGGG
ncbi:MAG: HK97 gp10 family phage protein [Rhabdaerophilum sp.]